MASIPTVHNFNGGGFAGFTELGGGVSENAGSLVADNNAVDCGLLRDAPFTETNTNAANGTKGTIHKFILGSTPTNGSKIRFVVNYVDADNYHYAELHKGGITIFDDLKNDRVTLWKRVAGVESQIGGATPLLQRQEETGDLRHAVMESSDAVTIIKVLNQYVVKVTATDPIDGLPWVDVIHLTETDGAVAAANEQAGIIFVGGQSHTNRVALWQGGLITCHYTVTPANGGSDANNGSQQSPFATIRKNMETVVVNQIGWFGAGTYNEAVGEGGLSPHNSTFANGTSWEDAVTFMPLAGATVTQTNTNVCYLIKAKARYRVLFGWTMDGLDTAHQNLKISNQRPTGSGDDPKHCRLQRMGVTRAGGEENAGVNLPGAVQLTQGIFPPEDATAEENRKFHHILDCNLSDNDFVETEHTGCHGFYAGGGNYLVEYNQLNRNAGNGGKLFDATGLTYDTTHDNMTRFNTMDGNRLYGWMVTSGTNNTAHSNIASNSTDAGSGTGIMIGYGAVDARVYNNVTYGNATSGIGVEVIFGPTTGGVIGAKIINNTSFGNRWNFRLQSNTGSVSSNSDDITWINNSAYAPAGAGTPLDFAFNSVITDPGHVSNLIFTKNHETSDVGGPFGAVFGDPQYVNVATFDFHLQSDSPLIEEATDPTAFFSEDFDRQPRPQGAAHDIGAFEFGEVGGPNEPPVITSNGGGATADINVEEGETAVTTVIATDADEDGITYSISGGVDAALFSIGPNDGVLVFDIAPVFATPTDDDANGIYEVEVQASDGEDADTQAISVTVIENTNAPPVITSNGGGITADIDVPEGTTAVTTVVATDADDDPITYSISGGVDAALFSIGSSSGVLTFGSAPSFDTPLDDDVNNVYEVIVQASDGVDVDTQALSVTVLNVGLLFHKTFINASTGANGFDSVVQTNGTVVHSAGVGLNGTSGGITCTRTADSPNAYGLITKDFTNKTILRTAWFTDISNITIGTDGQSTRLYEFVSSDGSTVAGAVFLIRIAGALNIRHLWVKDDATNTFNNIVLAGSPAWMELRVQRSSGAGIADAESHLYFGGGDYEPLGELVSTLTTFIHFTRFEQSHHRLGMRLGGASVSGSLIVDEWTMQDSDAPILFGIGAQVGGGDGLIYSFVRKRRR